MPGKSGIRVARMRDLSALVRLERVGFERDRFGPKQLRYLLTRANATTFVLAQGRKLRAAAIMLWRRNARIGRLYSIVTDPSARARGLGGQLLRACEEAAAQRACTRVSLEVRVGNRKAIGFYKRHGYRVAESLPGYYEKGADGVRLVKNLENRVQPEVLFNVPYFGQTLEFTCGPACLMMVMKHFNSKLVLGRSMELEIWKEATTIFMTSGLGGCGPFGLAVAARRRGFPSSVILSDKRTPFLTSVRKPEKREVIRLVHRQVKEEALKIGVVVQYFNLTFEDIVQALRAGAIPIVLISAYRLHRVRGPHWVVVTGFDEENVFVHDSYEGYYLPEGRRASHVRIPISEFRRMKRYGKLLQKSAILVRPPGAKPLRLRA